MAALDDKKGVQPVILDVQELSNVTDFFVIVHGNSTPHLKALAEEVHLQLKQAGAGSSKKSGTPESGWIVMDFVDVVVHVFSSETRDYYALEELWSDAGRIPLHIEGEQ